VKIADNAYDKQRNDQQRDEPQHALVAFDKGSVQEFFGEPADHGLCAAKQQRTEDADGEPAFVIGQIAEQALICFERVRRTKKAVAMLSGLRLFRSRRLPFGW